MSEETQAHILQAIASKRWTVLDEEWSGILAGEPQPASFHLPIIEKLAHKQQPEKLKALYEPLLARDLKANRYQDAFDLLDMITARDDRQDWARPMVLEALLGIYGDAAGDKFNDILHRSGLQDANVPLRKALQKWDDMMGAGVGQVFLHRSWGLGVVKHVDFATGEATIDFQLRPNQKMTLEGMRQFLERIPKGHIRAMMALHAQELRDMVAKEPGAVIQLALKSFGGKVKVADLKRVLMDRFLTEDQYKKFWEASKKAIKLDPWVDSHGAGANVELTLRTQPRSFFDAILGQVLAAKNTAALREVLRDVRRHGADAEMTAEDSEALYQLFVKPVKEGRIAAEKDVFTHGLLFLDFIDLFEGKENPVDVDPILRKPEALEYLREIEIHELRRIALERLIELQPESWGEIFADLAVDMDNRTVQWMEREFRARKDDHWWQVAIESIIAKPDSNPDLFLWASRCLLDGDWPHLTEAIPPMMIVEELLSLLAQLEDDTQSTDKAKADTAKNHTTKIRAILNEDHNKYFRIAVKKSTAEEARRVLQTIRLHNVVSRQAKEAMESILIGTFDDLRRISKIDEEEERRKPAFHYTTQKALDEKRGLLARLITNDIPAMAKVIEAARELGDLRENSEYHAAKDRQKLLAQQAAELEDLIARARVVEEKESAGDTTRFGSKIAYRDGASGDRREITILGMWETDLERNIISYLTPFGSQLMGKKVGDRFVVTTLDGRQQDVEILEISSVLAERS